MGFVEHCQVCNEGDVVGITAGALWLRTQETTGSTSFCPTLTVWKFMPKIAGVGAAWVGPHGRPGRSSSA
jgi:hypothetical protein